MKVLASIIIYNPNEELLIRNINAIKPQVDRLVLFNNSCSNMELLEGFLDEKTIILNDGNNLGISKPLNQIFQYANINGFEWVITLDQDSIVSEGIVSKYKEWTSLDRIGILTCNIFDRNTKIVDSYEEKYQTIRECITSGSFCSVDAYNNTDGFDEKLFIDGVDFDYCYSLTKYGYYIYKLNFNGLSHEIGKAKCIKIFGKKIIVFNESITRNYTIARNYFYIARKYPCYFSIYRAYLHEFKVWLYILLFEDSKILKIKNRIKGISDSKKM